MLKKKELRKIEIENKISKIFELLESIENIIPDKFEKFSKDDIVRDAIYKRVEVAIQDLIDIFYIINSDMRYGMPEVEDDITEHLKKNSVISDKSAIIFNEMKGFRNLLVHRYGDIDDKKAYFSIKAGLKDFELVIGEIEKFLKSH